jgi:hypothetical protein
MIGRRQLATTTATALATFTSDEHRSAALVIRKLLMKMTLGLAVVIGVIGASAAFAQQR